MKREHIIKEAEHELSASGYATVLASNMHTFADVFAEGKGRKFIIKAVHNIDSITRKEASALSKLSQFVGAEPLVVGQVSKNNKLRSNISYYRFSIRCISPEMLANLTSNEPNFLASKSVGVKVRIDGSRLRKLREMSNTKVSDLAREAQISKSTLYKHEHEVNYAAIRTVVKLESILNDSIKSEEGELRSKRPSLKFEEFARTGMQALQLNNGPFDIVAKKKNYYEISLDANARTLIKRASLFKAIRETFESNYPFFLSKKGKGKIRGVPVINKDEVLNVDSEDELLNLVY
jgi:putative transcriptional regulator